MKKRKTKRTASAATANDRQFLRLVRTVWESRDFSLFTDGFNVWVNEQPMGEERKQSVEVPRYIFNRLIKGYISKQKLRNP